jgi:hypothetical protein
MKEKGKEKATSGHENHSELLINAYFKEQIKKPGLLFCLPDISRRDDTESFIRQVLKEFPQAEALIYFDQKKAEPKPEGSHFLAIDKRDFSFFGKEKTVLKKWLSVHHFDLLLIFADKETDRCFRLIKGIKAKLKAANGIRIENLPVDITLKNTGKQGDYQAFYKAFKAYFKQLNIKL